jgi:hypothetical protein
MPAKCIRSVSYIAKNNASALSITASLWRVRKNMVEGDGFEPSKLSQQIYNLLPLATREPLQDLDGADYRSRTGDLLITSQLLYLLS